MVQDPQKRRNTVLFMGRRQVTHNLYRWIVIEGRDLPKYALTLGR